MKMDVQTVKSQFTKQQKNLLEAVESGTLADVKKLFPQFRSLETNEDFFNYILLVTALDRGHKSISKFLIKKDCPVRLSTKTKSHCTPLYFAVKMKDEDICKELCKRDASIHDKDANKESALELAMLERKFKLITFFLKYYLKQLIVKLDPNSEEDVALFHAACWIGSWDAEDFIEKYGFSPNSRSGFNSEKWKGFTPLHFVLMGKTSWSTIRSLWRHDDIDVFAEDEEGRTSLHLAFRSREYEFVDMYIKSIAVTEVSNPEDENGLSHFHITCSTEFSNSQEKLSHIKHLKNFIDSIEDIDSAVSLEDETYAGYTALHFAATFRCSYVVELLLENGADPAKKNKDGLTPLYVAINSNRYGFKDKELKVVQLLLEYGASVDAKDVKNSTPLHKAFYNRKEDEKLFQMLLTKARLTKNLTDNQGLSYFHIACSGNDLEKVKILMKKGASINSCVQSDSGYSSFFRDDYYYGYSALHFAIRFNQVRVVEFLLSNGVDVNITNGVVTPLQLVCSHSLTQYKFVNPIHSAFFDWSSSRNDRIHILKSLLEKNAEVDAKDSRGRTPLLLACSMPWSLTYDDTLLKEILTRRKMFVDILLCHGADINSCDDYGDTILHSIATHFQGFPSEKDFVESLLEKGAKLDVANKAGLIPLHIAVERGMSGKLGLSLIELFLEYFPEVNAKSEKSDTPLHLAVQKYDSGPKCQEIVQILLCDCPEIDVNIQNSSGDTPLHIAVSRRKYFCVGGLLEYGSDFNLKNSEGHTPLHIAHQWLSQETDEDENDELAIQYYLMKYVKLWIATKQFISDEVRALYESFIEHFPERSAREDSKVDEEVIKLKSQRIDQYNTLFDILSKDSDDMTKHVKNKNLDEIISSETLSTDFPLFSGMLELRFRQGEMRSMHLKSAIKAFNFITDINWPDSCIAYIMKYLSNSDLGSLVTLANRVIEAGKRSRQDSSGDEEPQPKLRRSKRLRR